MKLDKDLYAIDKTLLMKAGDNISRKALEKIAALPGKITYKAIKDTWLMKDLIKTFKDKRYTNILYPPETNQKIIRSISRIKMPEEILAELAYMKKLTPYTYRHIMVIAILSAKVSFDYSQRSHYLPELAMMLSLFHDLGKSRIPLDILDKPTPVTLHEREVLSSHPLIGYVLLHYYFGNHYKKYAFSSFQHHERLDGSGYPLGIKTLNKYSKLIGVVDALDALISERPYRTSPFSLRAAIDLLLDEAEKGKFHKGLVRTLIAYSRREIPSAKLVIAERGRDQAPAGNSYGITAES
ncbi:MAG: HD domain-containing phosphohydrolase [Smithella sp.]|jgi:HD-GYP domain-containing protein (c-di-GMP phosphodiesterase class II)